MRNALVAAVMALGIVSAGGWARQEAPLALRPESRLWVEGTSSTRSWSCKATVLEADIVGNDGNALTAVLSGEKGVREVTFRVPAPRMDCGNGTMTGHMKKALKADQHGTIAFSLGSYDVARDAEGAKATLGGTLTLGGVSKPITLDVLTRPASADQMRVTGSYALKMTDFGLKPPSLMMGVMKVGDLVTVKFDLLLAATPSTTTTP